MKLNINATVLKRVKVLEQREQACVTTAYWPEIRSCDEWSEVAQPLQEELYRATQEDGDSI